MLSPLILKATLVVVWFAMLASWERLRPAVAAPVEATAARLQRNLGLWLTNTAFGPFLVLPVSLVATGVDLGWRPAILSGWTGLVFDLLVLDLWIYWWHRANHVLPVLWRFHEIHHLDEFLDTTSAVRFHIGEVLLSAFVRAPLIVALGIPLTSILTFEALVLASALFHHSNVRLPEKLERALAYVVVTPSIHWVHHHAHRQDTDSNYATVLSLWDRLFGSASKTLRTAAMKIGVEGAFDRPFPVLATKPFQAV
jgi:sterol desaturase/sphingolipid hydroxylase (fatty acid hydroxylase superfamily)